MTDKSGNIVLRFGIIYVLIFIAFVAVIFKVLQIQIFEKEDWLKLGAKQVKRDIVVAPKRGNIYADDGRLLASSIPTYAVWMDVKTEALTMNNGKLFKDSLESLSHALSGFFGDKSPYQYKSFLNQAYQNRDKKRNIRLHPHRISYSRMKELSNLSLFKQGTTRSGLVGREYVRRVKPFGSLASRTIGDVYADESMGGRSGIEGSFNEYLIGRPGISHRVKAANRYVEMVDVPPIDGNDIYTTIDIEMQDIAEKALRDAAQNFSPKSACAIVMEVASGEIKAIVNLDRDNKTNSYYEGVNHAMTDKIEPGSTFKIASLIAVLDAGKLKTTDTLHIHGGRLKVANRTLTDHNAHRGGYDVLTVAESIHASSNVGTAKMVMKTFGKQPEKYVEKLYDLRLNDSLPLQLKGIAKPWIKHPKVNKNQWSAVTLAWMSIGYETQIPPIYTLALYNAVANQGRMMKPLLVKEIRNHEGVVKTFEPEVLKKSICKTSTLHDVQEIMLGVVEGKYGTAKNVQSDIVRIAGKTGTAQIAKSAQNDEFGRMRHNVSFCGYFPYENPQYTVFVLLTAPEGPPSGGLMAGSVVKNIAERTMIYKSHQVPEQLAMDTVFKGDFHPIAKVGVQHASELVSHDLHLQIANNDKDIDALLANNTTVPDAHGMAAKDAIYLLSRLGMRVQLHGLGTVVSQSLVPGSLFKQGDLIDLVLQ